MCGAWDLGRDFSISTGTAQITIGLEKTIAKGGSQQVFWDRINARPMQNNWFSWALLK